MGSEYRKNQMYLNRFQNFNNYYNKFNKTTLNARNLQLVEINHIIQADGFNCGPLVIYFFERYIKGESLNKDVNLSKYRLFLKEITIKRSLDMSNICLFCTRSIAPNDSEQCSFCLRLIHTKCLKVKDYKFIKNNMCDICRRY